MADLASRLDYYAIGRDYIVQRAKKIDPVQVDIEGSDANIFVGSVSVMVDHVTKQLTDRLGALTLNGSDDEDLDRYAFDRYQISRKGASPAKGECVIERPSFISGAGVVPVGTKSVTNSGFEYITTTTASFGATDLISRANIRAVEAGKSTQITANAIVRFQNPSALFDKTLTITNPKATAGGENVESDDLFRGRIRRFWRAARRGILAAIEEGAIAVPGVVSAQAIEVLTAGATPARLVNLFISDSTGVASDALAAEVRSSLNEYRAGGIQVLISTSLPSIVDITLRLKFRANTQTLELADAVRASIVEYVNSLPVNATLLVSGIYSVLTRFAADGLIASQESIVSPVGDLVPSVGQTLRTTIAHVVVIP